MRKILLILAILILNACTAQPDLPVTHTPMPPPPSPSPTPPPLALRRGINLGNMLEAPHEGDWGLTVHEEYFDLIRKAGFDFVRLPVRWFAHTTHTGHDDGDVYHEIDPAIFARVDEVVGWALERKLGILIDLHHYDELMSEPNEEQFLYLWQQIAGHYKDDPPQVMFELLNEPNGKIDAGLWNRYAGDALNVIRSSNPTRQVIIGPVQWNAFSQLDTLDVPDDPNVIVTFHYYEPFEFTHQGADWVAGSDAWLGTTWPGTDAQKARIAGDFDQVSDWAGRHHVRILLGEFGAYSRADEASRARWTAEVARQAEYHGFAWAYWEFGSVFGAYDPVKSQWREDLLKALIP